MAEFSVNTKGLKGQIGEEEKIAQELASIHRRLESQLKEIEGLGAGYRYIGDTVRHLISEVKQQEKGMNQLKTGLENIVKTYEDTEIRIVSAAPGNKRVPEAITSDEVMDEVEKAYQDGRIDDETYKYLRSLLGGMLAFGTAAVQNVLMGILQDKSAQAIANSLVMWLRENTTFFVDRGLMAALAGGGTAFLAEAPSWLASLIRGGAKYGVPIVGTMIDFGIQVATGEDAGDAIVKAGAHTAIGFGAAAAGAKAGAVIGTVIPVAGPIIGAVVGAGVGAVGGMAFDYVYDHWDDITEGVGDFFESAGNAAGDVFQGLGSIFG